jgi:hypothetical protein
MTLYSIDKISATTGLSRAYIRKCMDKKPQLFAGHQRASNKDGPLFDPSVLSIFRKIAELAFKNKSAIDQHKTRPGGRPLPTGSAAAQSGKPPFAPSIPASLKELNRLHEQLAHERQRFIEEKNKRLKLESEIRLIYAQIKPLTDNRSIDEAIAVRQNRRLKRAEIISRLQNLPLYKKKTRKKLFEELKALDTAFPAGKLQQDV